MLGLHSEEVLELVTDSDSIKSVGRMFGRRMEVVAEDGGLSSGDGNERD